MDRWRKPFGDVKIKRAREYELDNAIADLEKRGFELVKRGEEHKEVKRYNYEGNSIDRLSRFRYSDHQAISNYFAVMRKKEVAKI
ncbi:hypothetical protein CW357_00910 [Rummeliibacillus sp. TYF005]|uniref:hypothetical protein n=1 Tax=Rummeliibacillus sp. TYF005 TaxID=2058214 RepID=UPI000F5488D7|nr:hypothetical protein [Rummeliibacillus sp. TYF005]RPJ97259.1 hypothetical protein CW357_00910 [Rummeliibacillus sp. TYF005]